jgi:hypothetical protein
MNDDFRFSIVPCYTYTLCPSSCLPCKVFLLSLGLLRWELEFVRLLACVGISRVGREKKVYIFIPAAFIISCIRNIASSCLSSRLSLQSVEFTFVFMPALTSPRRKSNGDNLSLRLQAGNATFFVAI